MRERERERGEQKRKQKGEKYVCLNAKGERRKIKCNVRDERLYCIRESKGEKEREGEKVSSMFLTQPK